MGLVVFIAVLSLLIFVHEIGHFLAAKRAGIKVLEFGFGYPPRVFGKKIGETIYSVNLFPIGGFVRLFGEDAEEVGGIDAVKKAKLKGAFCTQSKRIRIVVIVAGVVMNVLLAVIIFSGLYTFMGIPTANEDKVQIIGVVAGSPADGTFEPEDEVVLVDGESVESTKEFQSLVIEREGRDVEFELIRKEETVKVTAVPRMEPPEGQGALGVVVGPKIEFKHYPIWQMPFRGIWFGVAEALLWGKNIIGALIGIFANLFSGVVPKDIGGPVAIYDLVSEVAEVGIVPLLQLVGVLSINLAVINFLPIPALDGGRFAFIVVEAVIGRRLNARMERLTHAVSMALLLALMLAITVQDIMRRFQLESLQALFERVVQL